MNRGPFWRYSRVAWLVLFAAALVAPGLVQGAAKKPKDYALIFGTVWDPDGHALYAVRVKIRRASEKKARWELQSDHSGEFAQRVPPGPGDYIVWADVKGYKLPDGKRLQPGTDVKVHIDGDERTDIGLHLNW